MREARPGAGIPDELWDAFSSRCVPSRQRAQGRRKGELRAWAQAARAPACHALDEEPFQCGHFVAIWEAVVK